MIQNANQCFTLSYRYENSDWLEYSIVGWTPSIPTQIAPIDGSKSVQFTEEGIYRLALHCTGDGGHRTSQVVIHVDPPTAPAPTPLPPSIGDESPSQTIGDITDSTVHDITQTIIRDVDITHTITQHGATGQVAAVSTAPPVHAETTVDSYAKADIPVTVPTGPTGVFSFLMTTASSIAGAGMFLARRYW
jgi:hypothetical protein